MAIATHPINSAPEINPIIRPVKRSVYGHRGHRRSKDGSDKKPKSGGMGRRLASKYKSKTYTRNIAIH